MTFETIVDVRHRTEPQALISLRKDQGVPYEKDAFLPDDNDGSFYKYATDAANMSVAVKKAEDAARAFLAVLTKEDYEKEFDDDDEN